MKQLPMTQTNEAPWLQTIPRTDARGRGNSRPNEVGVLEGWWVTAPNSGSSLGLKDVFLQSNPRGVASNPASVTNSMAHHQPHPCFRKYSTWNHAHFVIGHTYLQVLIIFRDYLIDNLQFCNYITVSYPNNNLYNTEIVQVKCFLKKNGFVCAMVFFFNAEQTMQGSACMVSNSSACIGSNSNKLMQRNIKSKKKRKFLQWTLTSYVLAVGPLHYTAVLHVFEISSSHPSSMQDPIYGVA